MYKNLLSESYVMFRSLFSMLIVDMTHDVANDQKLLSRLSHNRLILFKIYSVLVCTHALEVIQNFFDNIKVVLFFIHNTLCHPSYLFKLTNLFINEMFCY